ncbi:DUF1329 domain-containing protein [Synoicihabitans lomoniglobus]|uniref:DUF1329 domain-containing protein n=1 Tax=Synoicihabitans lomoniglobus TaxID=2909285 RepID=A0AAF0CQZ3_9BACT|nr:DUF1329 domain-containing protein [Opitutaceae bacterium LMO-M01]WED66428.1 DUF1329 domain-containing protein [Opitutaceae bacterium LMO-M01]
MKSFFQLTGGLLSATLLSAAISEADLARLGDDLTPLGGEVAGNADGSIPAWNGGLTSAPAGYTPGDHHPDPYASDTPLVTIDATNLATYRDQLTAGAVALIETYPDTYKVKVYPTHRSASVPQRISDATREFAPTARVVNDGSGVEGTIRGIPFPVPQSGIEVLWNHLLRYRGDAAIRRIGQAAPQRNGSYTMVEFEDEFMFNYARPDLGPGDLNNTIIFFKQAVLAPARLAGTILMVHETLDQIVEPRRAWVYNAGQRRVRRAPQVAYDNPGTAADGMRTSDQFDMFNGAPDRYTWELVGKREMIVPYNSYQLHSDQVSPDDILQPLHINQDLARYEKHRVWVVEARLKEGTSHVYSRRTLYVDEDSWQILAVDQYDTRGDLWRVSEAHCINYYDAQTFWSTLEVHTDLVAGRYLAIGLDNDQPMYDFTIERDERDYSPNALRKAGIR